MDNNSYDDEVATLYEEFTASLRKGADLSGFSKDDLIAIYDYAYDHNDDYVKTEILFIAARCYPDDRELKERKAMYYLDMGESDAARNVAASLPAASFIRRIVLLESSDIAMQERPNALVRLLEGIKPSSLDDEETIQLVGMFIDMNSLDWAKENIGRLKKLCRYPDTLLHELAHAMINAGDYECARDMVQELTMLDAFNADFWTVLAEIYIGHIKDFNEGAQCLDYALAIDPTSRKALMLKVNMLLERDGCSREVLDLLTGIVDRNSDDAEALYLRAVARADLGLLSESVADLHRCLALGQNMRSVLDVLLIVKDGQLDDDEMAHLRRLLSTEMEESVIVWVSEFIQKHQFGTALTLLRLYGESHASLSEHLFTLLLELLYRTGSYDEVISRFDKRYACMGDSYPNVAVAILYALSRKRVGDTAGLVQDINVILDSCDDDERIRQPLPKIAESVGYSFYLLQLRDVIANNMTDVAESFYDPFVAD